ncbi:MAG TPA: c-type cytochrome [Thermoanaerobaculia bacterium]|nr:c-type cytochrome [Thermoanaerobaculia bacterium]
MAAAALAEGAVLAFLAVRTGWRAEAEGTAVARGRRVAERLGCFGCHGPGGAAGIANPGAKTGSVPSWPGGTWMMYNHQEGDVQAWILDGHPPDRQPDAEALIKMPAFRGRLAAAELGDLVAFVLAASQFGELADPQAAAGRDAALRYGCFGCHGPEGRGLIDDPGSLKGYVPPWDGPDYPDLVRSDDEFRQWVRNGITDRFRANPAARHFVETEAVRMPAFGDRLKPEELNALLAYVTWVRKTPRGSAAAPIVHH